MNIQQKQKDTNNQSSSYNCKIFIKKLQCNDNEQLEETEKNLLHLFSNIGQSTVIQKEFKRRFAFVTFSAPESVNIALWKSFYYNGKKLNIQKAEVPSIKRKKQKNVKNAKKIFVGGIPSQVTKKELIDHFQKYGQITDLCLPYKSKTENLNKGFCFITFKNSESISQIIKDYKKHFLRSKWVEVKIAKPRSNNSPNFKAYKKQSNDFDEEQFLSFQDFQLKYLQQGSKLQKNFFYQNLDLLQGHIQPSNILWQAPDPYQIVGNQQNHAYRQQEFWEQLNQQQKVQQLVLEQYLFSKRSFTTQ